MAEPIVPPYDQGERLLRAALADPDVASTERTRRLMSRARGLHGDPGVLRYLIWKYRDHALLEAAGHVYPVAIFPSPDNLATRPDAILATPLDRTVQPDGDLLPGSAHYRAAAHRLGSRTVDLPCYTMRRLTSGPGLRTEAALGSYHRALDTCDELAWELAVQAERLGDDAFGDLEALDAALAGRSQLHAAVPDPVLDGRRRSAALGVSVLLAYRDGDQVRLAIQQRSPHTLAAHMGLHHVAPSFMFQPTGPDAAADFSVLRGVHREYLEELFDRPEPASLDDDPCLDHLLDLQARGLVHVRLTGVAVDLLNLRPEVCLLVFIDTSEWVRHHTGLADRAQRFALCDEWAQREAVPPSLAYQRHDDRLLPAAGLCPTCFVPPGAAALWLGKWQLDAMGF